MRINEIFNRLFYCFLGATFFVGILPIILYPFSRYFGKEEEYSEGNHGPLHQFPDGDWNRPPPQGIDWLIEKTDYINDYNLLIKINKMFELNKTNIDNNVNIKVFENINIENGPIQNDLTKEILKKDGFIFPSA